MWVVVSTKGGIGKSIIAKNLLVPYVVKKYGKALYVNTDDTNDEEKLIKKVNNFKTEISRITPKNIVELDPLPYAVLDTGAGRNSVEVLKALASIDYQDIAKVVIPVSKRLSEINEAIKTYNTAKKLGFERVVLVLNRVSDFDNYREEFTVLFSPLKDKPLIEHFGEDKDNLVLFPYDDKEILGNIEDLERRLPYDAYLEADAYISQYREKKKERKLTQEDRVRRRFLGYLKEIFGLILREKNLQILEGVDEGVEND